MHLTHWLLVGPCSLLLTVLLCPAGAKLTGAKASRTPPQDSLQRRGKAPPLPECATQQVCSALYVRLNRSQPLCACPSAFSRPCSESKVLDEHTIKLVSTDKSGAFNLVKVCEPVLSIRRCKEPRDWQLLALQSTRTGRAHYLLICRCPTGSRLLGPVRHSAPPYANIPGIRVYGMLCAQDSPPRESRGHAQQRELYPEAPWTRILEVIKQSGMDHRL
ncbi:uncharacterized protein LOC115313787 [Ixodes scapularis]|uniref:uncharacterized protein LOC115313787 n=1 Tax=Ixodes scapularis TaxID=6945 RepID=UPI0011615D17|nr:uncharacterized protein LOC115313787 [Ixodes scapularis]